MSSVLDWSEPVEPPSTLILTQPLLLILPDRTRRGLARLLGALPASASTTRR